jgi:hypothetical protein
LHRSCSPLRGSAAELLETHIGALDARIEELTAQRDELVPALRLIRQPHSVIKVGVS